MSGSGGYYKYRCKYWLTYNCPNWVWVNDAPCAHCLADGRDSDTAVMPGHFRISREVYVPQFENGFLHYMVMGIIAGSDTDSGWVIKQQPAPQFPSATGPTAMTITATDGPLSQRAEESKSVLQAYTAGSSWTGNESHLE